MNTVNLENLDLVCAKLGKTIAANPSKDLENLITNALAVLEEQGVYALFLFLKSRLKSRDSSEAEGIIKKLHDFLKKNPQQAPLVGDSADDIFTSLQPMAEDIDKLLLARDLIRQALVYARYHARVQEKGEVRA